MRRLRILVPLVAATLPGPLAATVAAEPQATARYVVVMRDSAGVAPDTLASDVRRRGGQVHYVYRHALRGFAASLTATAARELSSHAAVATVSPDGPVHVDSTQVSPSWGLDRIDQRAGLDGTYSYTATGAGVTAYVIDSGVRISHVEFGGRASYGYDALGSVPDDCNGHGTHVAGTVGGTTYGVAKQVRVVAVRVLNCEGSGMWSGVVAGVDWVTGDHDPGEAAVANMSLGGFFNSAANAAVAGSIADGVSYSVSAGNSIDDACDYSPASVPAAMTTGATSPGDVEAWFSNYGPCVDWYAPGDGILSADMTSDVAVNVLSGTSMASPHVAGVAAQYLQYNPAASPATVRTALATLLTQGVVAGNSDSFGNDDLLYTNL